MKRVVGAGLLILLLGGAHLGGLVADRPFVPASSVPPAETRQLVPARERAAGLPGAYHEHPLRFLSVAPPDSLALLPGIGPVLSARIVADRAARGPFTTWTELDRVPGIGPATIRRLESAARRR